MQPEPMIVVDRYPTADEARQHAAALVERGVGATVEPFEPDEGGGGPDEWVVTVMPDDRARARELLGLAPDGLPVDETDELTRSVRTVLVPVLLGLVVLVTVPLLAFFVSFKLSGG